MKDETKLNKRSSDTMNALVRCKWLERPENLHLHMAARDFIKDKETTGTSELQRHFRLGYLRASQLISSLEDMCVVLYAGGTWNVLIQRDWVKPNDKPNPRG